MTQEEVYQTYHDRIVRYINGKVSNIHVAEDLTSDVFVKVYSKFADYDESKASISTWIYTIANNRVIDYYRTNHISEDIDEQDIREDFSIEDSILREEALEELAQALGKLPERERDLIIMHYYDGINLKEISVRMKLSYSYIKILHNKSLNMLKGLLA